MYVEGRSIDVEMLEIMRRRRSIRKFVPGKVSDAEVEALLSAALLAPSAKNIRPVEIFVLRDEATIARLAACRDAGGDAFKTATLALLVAGRSGESDLWEIDAAIAATHILLQAEALGLGCCWVQAWKRPCGDGTVEDAVRRVVDLPQGASLLCMMALGHGDEEKAPYDLGGLDRSRAHVL